MRYAAVAKLNSEQSLHAMWQAFRARSFADQQLVENDAGVVLALLNARYYNPAQGQFLTQDPTFLAIGDRSQLQQLTKQEQQKVLSDPQQLNSYSYARGNPISSKDPSGLWALKLGAAGTIPGWGLSGEVGIQLDLQGIEYYYGAGLAGGGGLSFGPQITTADLSHQYSVSTEAFAQGGAGVSIEMSKGMAYFPYSDRKAEPYQDATVGFPAVELAGGVMGTVSGPIITWSSRPSIKPSLPKPQMINNLSMPAANSFARPSMNYSRPSSGGGSYTQAQVLSDLRGALIQLSAVLATYQSGNNNR